MDKTDMLLALLPDIAFDGWDERKLLESATRHGISRAEFLSRFPHPARDLIAAFSAWADARMLAEAGPLADLKVRERIARLVWCRLTALIPHEEALRRALAVLALPQNAALAARLTWATCDAAWQAAGDRADDFNHYTKRGLLAGVLGSTTLAFLSDRGPGKDETRAFLDRRIDNVLAAGRLIGRLERVTKPLSALSRRMPGPHRRAADWAE